MTMGPPTRAAELMMRTQLPSPTRDYHESFKMGKLGHVLR